MNQVVFLDAGVAQSQLKGLEIFLVPADALREKHFLGNEILHF